ncbi:hypothetical protein [Mycobacterium intracellulare]|uniref:hypothetical protein n=1 Tax=Mycobacterium intracellulare TaxID=1767 RepID=UPI0019167D78|nr:hypothetical protein [Mycobacterium intracellulare]
MTPQEHDREHAAIFAEYRQAVRDGKPTGTLADTLRYSDRRWAGRWARYYQVHGSRVLHTGLRCGAMTGRNSRALVTLQWWLSGELPTMPLCQRCERTT